MIVLLVIAVCVTGIGRYSTWEKNKNYISIAGDIITTWGMFVCCAYIDIYKKTIVDIGLAAVCVSLIMSLFVFLRKINRQEKKRQIVSRRISRIIGIWKMNIAYASLYLLSSLGQAAFTNEVIINSNTETTMVYGDEDCLDANIEVIANMAPDKWSNLNIQEKLYVCQKIINCEARYLGLSHAINVETAELSKNTLGCYSDAQHKIYIDMNYLTNSGGYDVLKTLIHECTHAYQHEQVQVYESLDEETRNLLIFYDASIYMEEFANYVTGKDDFLQYYNQKAEVDARNAEENESSVYIEKIKKYWEIQGVE